MRKKLSCIIPLVLLGVTGCDKSPKDVANELKSTFGSLCSEVADASYTDLWGLSKATFRCEMPESSLIRDIDVFIYSSDESYETASSRLLKNDNARARPESVREAGKNEFFIRGNTLYGFLKPSRAIMKGNVWSKEGIKLLQEEEDIPAEVSSVLSKLQSMFSETK